MSDYPHQYDYAGHQPGCGVCAEERKQRHDKEWEKQRERVTVKHKIIVETKYIVYNEDGLILHEQQYYRYYDKGNVLEPTVYAAAGLNDAYNLLDAINKR